jgi:hypothetical protein
VFHGTIFGAIKIFIHRQILLVPIFCLVVRRFAITSKERHDWQELCLKAVKESDPEKQAAIVAELNRIYKTRARKHKWLG